MRLWTCSGTLDLYWGEGAFGPFQFKHSPLGLGLVVRLWTCTGALDLYWGERAFGPFQFKHPLVNPLYSMRWAGFEDLGKDL